MGAKSLYLDNREKYKEQMKIENNIEAIKAIQHGRNRFDKYKQFWEVLDLDEIVDKLFKNPVYENKGQKFTITDLESNYIIYCDNGGSYFRIGDKNVNEYHAGHYLNSKLEPVLNEVIGGKITGMDPNKRRAITHFKMLIKKKGNE